MATVVVNKSFLSWDQARDPRYIYIGRPTKWGNPWSHKLSRFPDTIKVKTRDESVENFRRYLRERPELIEAVRRELRGKFLVCFCRPHACHGDVLARVADGGEP